MESRAEQALASPTWGREEKWETVPARARHTVRLEPRGSTALDTAGAALVLGSTAALWLACLVALS